LTRDIRGGILPGIRSGDWRSKLIGLAQLCVGFVALLGLLAMTTKGSFLLVSFTLLQGLLLVGIVLFAIVVVFSQQAMVLEQYGAGEIIFREGDEGRHVYVIKSGTVEVLQKGPDRTEQAIARLQPGDHFGEIALIQKAPRTATIRTATAVQVYRMNPNSFVALYTNLPGFRDHFKHVMESRLKDLTLRR
jgi:hypothetical protein